MRPDSNTTKGKSWVYYTTENPGKWQLIPDTEQGRKEAVKKGAMYFTWTRFSEPYQGNGEPEPRRWGDFPLDFDSEKDPEKALQDLRTLCLIHLPELLGIDPYGIQFFASGSKGFHAVIPAKFFDAQTGDPYLPLIYKRIASEWKEKLGLKTLDLSLYNMQRGKMFRIPNVKRSNDRYKAPLSVEEVMELTMKEVAELTKAPREIDPVDVDISESDELGNLYRNMRAIVHREVKARPEPIQLNEDERKRLTQNLPPCVSYILTALPPKSEMVNFNRLTMLLVNYFQMTGWNKQDVWAKAQSFIEQYPHSESYDTLEKRLEHWQAQWGYLMDNSAYTFNCSYVKSLGLPGNAFDCSRCIGKTRENSLLWEFDDLTDWQTIEPPPLEWAFDGLIPKRIVAAIFARGGTGKTYFIEAMILGTITGRKVFRLFDPVTPKRVLALLSEDPPEVTRSRFYWIGETFISHALSRQDLQDALNYNLRLLCTRAAPLMQFDGKGNPERSKAFDWLKDKVETFDPHVIFIDPKSQFYGLDEQNNDHNTVWVNTLKELTTDGATVVFAHHVPKKVDAFSVDALRGGGALGDACRWAMGMQGLDEIQAKELDIDDPWNYVHCRISKNSYAPLDGTDFFFKRGARGELQRVDPRIALLKAVANRISEVLGDHYKDEGKNLTRRAFIRDKEAKDMRWLIEMDYPKANRKTLEQSVEYGVRQGILSEIDSMETSRSRRVIKYLRPGGYLI